MTERFPEGRKLVLTRDGEGKWGVDLERSIKATTGREKSFVLTEAVQMRQRAQQAQGGGPDMTLEARQGAIREVAEAVIQWAEDHDGRLPPGQTWLDDVEAYSLDGKTPARPGAGEGECGYGLNAALAGTTLPERYAERKRLVLLFECADSGRNVVGDPEQDPAPVEEDGGPSLVALASGEALSVSADASPADALDDLVGGDMCMAHVRTLVKALRLHAREHDGYLPKAASCAMISLRVWRG